MWRRARAYGVEASEAQCRLGDECYAECAGCSEEKRWGVGGRGGVIYINGKRVTRVVRKLGEEGGGVRREMGGAEGGDGAYRAACGDELVCVAEGQSADEHDPGGEEEEERKVGAL